MRECRHEAPVTQDHLHALEQFLVHLVGIQAATGQLLARRGERILQVFVDEAPTDVTSKIAGTRLRCLQRCIRERIEVAGRHCRQRLRRHDVYADSRFGDVGTGPKLLEEHALVAQVPGLIGQHREPVEQVGGSHARLASCHIDDGRYRIGVDALPVHAAVKRRMAAAHVVEPGAQFLVGGLGRLEPPPQADRLLALFIEVPPGLGRLPGHAVVIRHEAHGQAQQAAIRDSHQFRRHAEGKAPGLQLPLRRAIQRHLAEPRWQQGAPRKVAAPLRQRTAQRNVELIDQQPVVRLRSHPLCRRRVLDHPDIPVRRRQQQALEVEVHERHGPHTLLPFAPVAIRVHGISQARAQ